MSDLLFGIVLSVCICWFHNMVTLPPWLVSTDFGTCSYQCFLSNCIPVSLHMLKCSCAHTLSGLFMYCSFASIGHADIMWCIVSSNCWQSLHLLSVFMFNIFVELLLLLLLVVILSLNLSSKHCRIILNYLEDNIKKLLNGWGYKIMHCVQLVL